MTPSSAWLLRPMTAPDTDWVLALSSHHELETGPLDVRKLDAMRDAAFAATVAVPDCGYLIAFDQSGDYDSANFRWFQGAYDRFVYVDRIVVAPSVRGRGLARAFYRQLSAQALAGGHTRLVCEVNEQPPNPVSQAFHNRLGFVPVGRAVLADGKQVVYLERHLTGTAI